MEALWERRKRENPNGEELNSPSNPEISGQLSNNSNRTLRLFLPLTPVCLRLATTTLILKTGVRINVTLPLHRLQHIIISTETFCWQTPTMYNLI